MIPTDFRLPVDQVQDQVERIVLGLKINTSERLIVNLPGMSWAAAAVLASIQGLYGKLPEIVRSVRDEVQAFHIAEIIDLQSLRDKSRESRFTNAGNASLMKPILINFSHPVTQPQLDAMGFRGGIINVETHVEPRSNYAVEAVRLVNEAGLSPHDWQSSGEIIVNIPSLAPLAAAVLIEINARMGVFPKIIRLDRQIDNSYAFAELIYLQQYREMARGLNLDKVTLQKRVLAEIVRQHLNWREVLLMGQPTPCIYFHQGNFVFADGKVGGQDLVALLVDLGFQAEYIGNEDHGYVLVSEGQELNLIKVLARFANL